MAGCDAFRAPCGVIREFLTQGEVAPAAIASQLETSYADRLGIDGATQQALSPERIARLSLVEPGLIEFLVELRAGREYHHIQDGKAPFRRFDRAGFGDLFFAPTGQHVVRSAPCPVLTIGTRDPDPFAPRAALCQKFLGRSLGGV